MTERANDTTGGAADKGHDMTPHGFSSGDLFAMPVKDARDLKPPAEIKHPVPSDSVSAADRPRLLYLQTTLTNFLPVVEAEQKPPKDQSAIALQLRQLGVEAARHEFGPATKEAYGDYLKWMEGKTLPEARRDLNYVGLPETDSARGALAAPPADLRIDAGRMPGDAELAKLDNAMRWAQQSDARVDVATKQILQKVDDSYTNTVNKLGLPHGWLADIDKDHERWRKTVGPLINNALSARSNIEIIDELHKAGGSVDVESLLHKGAGITRDANGSINGIHLNLPHGWDLSSPDNGSRAKALANFVNESNDALTSIMPDLSAVRGDVGKTLSWGDTELKNMQGRFDQEGHFLSLIKKGDPVRDGEHAQDVNMLKSRYSIEEKAGKIILHQSVQAQSVPWWGYQNLIGVSDVGKPVQLTRTLNPDDNVIMRTAGGYEVKQARDLDSYKNWHMASYYGEKALMGTLDAGLLVKGGLETKAAFAAAGETGLKMAATDVLTQSGVKAMSAEGVEVSSRQLTRQAAGGALNMSVGALGFLNNAGARESSLGENINTARSLYFLGGAAKSLGSFGMRATRATLGTAEAAPVYSAQLHGLGEASSATGRAYKVVTNTFRASEYGFVPLIAADVRNSVSRLHNDKNRHVVRAAEIAATDTPESF